MPPRHPETALTLTEFKEELLITLYNFLFRQYKQTEFYISLHEFNKEPWVIHLKKGSWELLKTDDLDIKRKWSVPRLTQEDNKRIAYMANLIIEARNAENLWLLFKNKLPSFYIWNFWNWITNWSRLKPLKKAWESSLRKFPCAELKAWDKNQWQIMFQKLTDFATDIKELKSQCEDLVEQKSILEIELSKQNIQLIGVGALQNNYKQTLQDKEAIFTTLIAYDEKIKHLIQKVAAADIQSDAVYNELLEHYRSLQTEYNELAKQYDALKKKTSSLSAQPSFSSLFVVSK